MPEFTLAPQAAYLLVVGLVVAAVVIGLVGTVWPHPAVLKNRGRK